jgi:glutathionylspermidine synthase
MQLPWQDVCPLEPELFAALQRETIFTCCKWDPQVEDAPVLAPLALFLRPDAWRDLERLAEALARETLAAERDLQQRPELHRHLALPRAVRRGLRASAKPDAVSDTVRVMRFDFHFTKAGWQISEANTDVPGGFNEAAGFTQLLARHLGAPPPGDPVAALRTAIQDAVGPQAKVALVHATAFTDDRQVMAYLSQRFRPAGLETVFLGPDHLCWRDGRAWLDCLWAAGPVDLVYRFYPGEWLPHLPARCRWVHFFGGALTPICNPATALLTQSKRFPLVWDSLPGPLATWRALLPASCDPRQVGWERDEAWVVKPAWGRVGEWIGLHRVTTEEEWRLIRRSVRWGGRHWVAQRRFEAVPLPTADGPRYPCFGVYTVNGRAAGVYGRIARQPLINHQAQDVAVLLAPATHHPAQPQREPLLTYDATGAF